MNNRYYDEPRFKIYRRYFTKEEWLYWTNKFVKADKNHGFTESVIEKWIKVYENRDDHFDAVRSMLQDGTQEYRTEEILQFLEKIKPRIDYYDNKGKAKKIQSS